MSPGEFFKWLQIFGIKSAVAVAWADITGKPSAFPTVPIVITSPSRAMVSATNATGFQISSTRNADVRYDGQFSTTTTIGGPAAVTVFLETADTNSTNPGDWTVIAKQSNSANVSLAVVLQSQDSEPWHLSRIVTLGKWVRIRYAVTSGTAAATINPEQQEVLL